MKKSFLLAMMAVLLSLAGCQKEQEFPAPKVNVTPEVAGENSLSFNIVTENAEKCAYLCIEAVTAVPTVDAVLETGVAVDPKAGMQTVENLKPATRYYIVAAAASHDMKVISRTVAMTTLQPVDPQAEPKVAVTLQEKAATEISFKIVPENAVKCSYVCVEAEAEAGSVPSAQEIIKKGVRVFPNAESIQHVNGLMEGSEYVIIAAAQNGEQFTTTELKVETSLGEEIEFVPETGKGHKIIGNNYFVRLINGENVLNLDFFAEESEVLPAGTYVLSPNKEEFAIWTTSSKFGKDGQYRTFSDGEVNVELDGEVYTISFYMIMDDATILTGSYTGELEGMFVEFPKYERPGAMKFSGAKAKHFKYEALLTFFCEDGLHNLILDIYFPKMDSKEYLPLGEFPLMQQAYAPGSYVSTISSNLKDLNTGDEDHILPDQGLVTIGVENGEYVITMSNLMTASGVLIDDVYRGQLNNVKVPVERENVEITLDAMKYVDLNDKQPGEFFLKGNDSGYKYEVAIDFQGAEGDKQLQAGTYKFGEGANSFGSKSYVTAYSPYASVSFTSGTVTVGVEEAVYTIAVDAIGNDEKHYLIQFSGEVADMPGDEVALEEIVMDLPYVSGYFNDDNTMYCINAFNFDADNSFEIAVYLHGEAGDDYLKPGKYTFSTEKTPFTFDEGTYISFYDPWEYISPNEGYVNVSLEGTEYTIEIRLIKGEKLYKADYVGVLQGCVLD